MFLQPVLGGATACSAETHAAVRTGVCVTLSTGLVSVDWAGLDPAVTLVRLHRQQTQQNISELNKTVFCSWEIEN